MSVQVLRDNSRFLVFVFRRIKRQRGLKKRLFTIGQLRVVADAPGHRPTTATAAVAAATTTQTRVLSSRHDASAIARENRFVQF